jgi:ABC-type polysaccharide/polyol phosphate export permease
MSMVPQQFRTILAINPMVHLVEIYRVIILQGRSLEWSGLLYTCLFGLFLFFLGERIFYRLKPAFDDYL